jgi:hypothetical protein
MANMRRFPACLCQPSMPWDGSSNQAWHGDSKPVYSRSSAFSASSSSCAERFHISKPRDNLVPTRSVLGRQHFKLSGGPDSLGPESIKPCVCDLTGPASIVVGCNPDKIVYASGASGNLDLWMVELTGTGQKQLSADAGNNSWPSVSSDGRYVVFMSVQRSVS